MTGPVLIGVVVMAVVLAIGRGQPLRRLRRLGSSDENLQAGRLLRSTRLLPSVLRRRRGPPSGLAHPDRQDVADLVGRLAALTRAGVASGRAWQVLAEGGGSVSRVARTT